MTVELTAEQETQLADIARNTERTTDEIAQEVFAQFLAAQAEHRAAIRKSRESIAAGRTVSHEEVMVRLKQRFGW